MYSKRRLTKDPNCKLYLPFDGLADQTVMKDMSSSANTVTPNVNAKITQTTPKMGSGCLTVDGASHVLVTGAITSVSLSSDFTVEFWVRLTDVTAYYILVCSNTDDTPFFRFLWYGAGNAWYLQNQAGTTFALSDSLSNATWYHISVVRSSGVITLYRDGVYKGKATDTRTFQFTDGVLIGSNVGGKQRFNGQMDDLQIHNIALHSSAFTPPTRPYNITAVDRAYAYKANSVLKLHLDAGWSSSVISAQDATLVAVYKMESGLLTTDSIGANTLTNNNTVTNGTGKSGSCGSFAAISSQSLSIGSLTDGSVFIPSSASGAKYLVSLWFNAATLPTSGGTYTPCSCARHGFGKWTFTIREASGSYTLSCAFWDVPGNQKIAYQSSMALSTGAWYHMVLAADGSYVRGWLNGVELTTKEAYTTLTVEGTNTFGIGKYCGDNGNPYYFDGLLDEVMLWKSPTIADWQGFINALYSKGVGKFYTSILDSSDYGHTITRGGDAQVTTTGPKLGTGCLLLDGTGDYLTVPQSTLFNFGSNYTVEGWFKDLDGTTGYIISTYSSVDDSSRVILKGVSGTTVYVRDSADGTTWSKVSFTYTAGTWYHFAVVKENSVLKLYLDGVLQTLGTEAGDAFSTASEGVYVGAAYDTSIVSPFKGSLDEINISNYAKYLSSFVPNARGAF